MLPGIGKVDGTVFVRAAGVMVDTLGWGEGGEKGEWDRSALGWDEAWIDEKEKEVKDKASFL